MRPLAFSFGIRGKKKTGSDWNKSNSLTKALGLLMLTGWGFQTPPRELPGSRIFFKFLEILRRPRGIAASNRKPAQAWLGRGPGHERVKAPPRWPPCFALQRGSRGRLPFASGEAVKALPLALCPRRLDGISSPARPALRDLRTFQAPGEPNSQPSRQQTGPWRSEAGRPPRRYRAADARRRGSFGL